MVKIKKLLDKFNIKTEDHFPKTILDIEIDNDIKEFKKGYKHKGSIIFNGEYTQKDGKYKRVFNIRIIITLPSELDYEILEKLESFNSNSNKNIWNDNEEAMKGLELLNTDCVEYYVSSEDLPTLFIAYNILGGINRHS